MRRANAFLVLGWVVAACAAAKMQRTSVSSDEAGSAAPTSSDSSSIDEATTGGAGRASSAEDSTQPPPEAPVVASPEPPPDRGDELGSTEAAESGRKSTADLVPREPPPKKKKQSRRESLGERDGTEELVPLTKEDRSGSSIPDPSDRPKDEAPDAYASRVPASRPPSTAGVKAGAADDNMQFNAFLRFVDENASLGLRHDVSHRVVLTVSDRNGLPVANAEVAAVARGTNVVKRKTYADGRVMLFPSTDPRLRGQDAELVVSALGVTQRLPLAGPLVRKITLDAERSVAAAVPLDIVFVLDTTGSMGDEIEQLRKTIQVIHWQISNLSPRPDVRFGMVLFKDQEDEYVTRVVPFTSDLSKFQSELATVSAGGGGDTPEDVEAALEILVRALPWRPDGLRLAFLIGDAPPHLDYQRPFNYVSAIQEAAAKGIKITSIGASGLDRQGELIWRQVAQYTMAPFVFLTYGETSDSEGSASSVSHHVGSNWVADSLDAIVIKMVKVELGHFGARGAPARDDFFEAVASGGLASELVLDDLFRQSVKQLLDYSVEPIPDRSPTSILPVASKKVELEKKAEKLSSRLELAFGRMKTFQLIETKATPKLMELVAIQMGPSFDAGGMVEVGKLVPARFAVLSQLDEGSGGGLELVVKLVRLETGEVVSMSMLKIDQKLLG
ncbi:MAG: VWA domain-containing protein [Deltaproteobacteria bacterium]|nr:VWA domain-containing protein [Deltaproteobacteria bacterium]